MAFREVGKTFHRAEDNLEKALSFFDRRNQGELSIELLEIGDGYEALADVSGKDKCRFYENAGKAFARQLPLINGDSYAAYGKTIRLEPVRSEVRKHLHAVNEKSAKASRPVSWRKLRWVKRYLSFSFVDSEMAEKLFCKLV
jgi:hypothetical protein